MMNSMKPYTPEIIQKSVKNIQLSYNSTTKGTAPMNEAASNSILTFSYCNNVPCSVKENLKLLISKFDDGLWCANLPNVYLQTFGKELDFMKYRYRSLITMCMDLQDIFYTVRPGQGDSKLYDKQKPLPKDYDKHVKTSELLKPCNALGSKRSTKPALPDVESLRDVIDFTLPPEVLNSFDHIPRQFLPEDVKEDDYINVSVGEIYDPSKFWILLHNCTVELNNLMDEMQHFYKNCDSLYEIPKYMIGMGLYCAALYDSEYHRAIIVKVLPWQTNKVEVYYMDYGTVSAVSTEGLYYLHRKFSQLPQQAIRARLAKIYPPLSHIQWSQEASLRFLELVKMKLLVAHIYRIDYKRLILEIFLVDTSGEDDVFMNDTLVNKGYAIFTHQKQERPNLLMTEIPRVRHIHLFPTFDEIEVSKVPSADDMIQCSRFGILPQLMYPQYYYQQFDIAAIEKLDHLEGETQNSCESLGREAVADGASWNKLYGKVDGLSSISESSAALDTPVYEAENKSCPASFIKKVIASRKNLGIKLYSNSCDTVKNCDTKTTVISCKDVLNAFKELSTQKS